MIRIIVCATLAMTALGSDLHDNKWLSRAVAVRPIHNTHLENTTFGKPSTVGTAGSGVVVFQRSFALKMQRGEKNFYPLAASRKPPPAGNPQGRRGRFVILPPEPQGSKLKILLKPEPTICPLVNLTAPAPPTLPAREVMYSLPVEIVESIKAKHPSVEINGSRIRLFGPMAGLQPGEQKLRKVETLSDHAPMEWQGVHSWNVMQQGKVKKKYTNVQFRDVSTAFESGQLKRGTRLESQVLYEARMYAIVRVILHMIKQSMNFKAFFLQEASMALLKLFQSDEIREKLRLLNVECLYDFSSGARQKITLLNKSELPTNWNSTNKDWQNDKLVQEIAKKASARENGLLLSIPRSYALKVKGSIHQRSCGSEDGNLLHICAR
eukprot:gnl/MRDRNA2_/MRDRNA2_14465_c0_seq1.p1 gnl/MRDRNA2_/MRDRNA2_14465_c0~~gnl/MRDRNA2_/MRDRNA2_14465_c0_seq1.p1  ORF type:complete len:380 (+),score=37.57 gnl/MRDRNA2_/MRDRNA2_14465_c0_seq1:29-1168(+)